ncbi:TlpA disulfide reductase family protein [Fibrobacter sp. UWB11]|uniref:TlpA disulfide reductase family protein n=1 Tax=Fibrobacter sp. UWB11 TaxID=1896202 RepID=UPI000927CA15|nr:TlpA disulfide reductase family protein [Fibrobacter sp. UWB11]SIO05045.1 AhpC/TSA family protein [Fibrobacter sp. UWB11]
MIRILFLVAFLTASLSFAAPASDSEKSRKIELPKTIADSLPWFAVREFSESMVPFTRVHLQKLTQKSERTALVYFATWCIPCRVGVKRLVENYDELKKNNVSVVLVNIGERDEGAIKKWIQKLNASVFTVVIDPFKRLTEGFGLVKENEEISLPRTIVLDSKMKPLFMLSEEGQDWPQVLWAK